MTITSDIEQQLLLRQDLVFVDLETTGLDPSQDRVIEVGIVRISKGKVLEQYNSLINPQIPIPPSVKAITGIKTHQLLKAPTFAEVREELQNMLRHGIFVAHNADFDYGFIESEFSRIETPFALPRLCTVKLSRELYPDYMSHSLDSISQRFGIPIDNRHRAKDDALATWEFVKISQTKLGQRQVEQAIVRLVQEAKPKRMPRQAQAQLALI